ncbi:MAG: adenosylcobinamide amidohydrolase [Deltaproteobacteria bacterium]|nr:adenosylcobinamide amidohydrolase [Deltaproteobacteria bacterium]
MRKKEKGDILAQSSVLSPQSYSVLWNATVRERTLVVILPESYAVLSWAPLAGGLVEAHTILNHQVRTDEYPAHEPEVFLQALARRLQLKTPVVGLMTGVKMERLVRRIGQQDPFVIECFATVGLSNALAVGDPATYEESPGTINLMLVINRPLTAAALVEAVAITTEAKVRALYAAGVKSTVSEARATGTGTDCVAIACPLGEPAYRYCGKHTQLGALLGRVVCEAMTEGLQRAGAVGSP